MISQSDFGLFALRDPGEAIGDLSATHVAWKHQKGIAKVSSPLLYRNRLWVIADGGLMTCTDPATGRIIFDRERLGANAGGDYFASPVAADGRIFLCSSRGTVSVIEAADTLNVILQTSLGAPIHATRPSLVIVSSSAAAKSLRIRRISGGIQGARPCQRAEFDLR